MYHEIKNITWFFYYRWRNWIILVYFPDVIYTSNTTCDTSGAGTVYIFCISIEMKIEACWDVLLTENSKY